MGSGTEEVYEKMAAPMAGDRSVLDEPPGAEGGKLAVETDLQPVGIDEAVAEALAELRGR